MASVKTCQLKPIPGNPSILFQWKYTRAVLASNTSLKIHGSVRTALRNLCVTCVDVTSPIYPFNVTVYVSGQFRRYIVTALAGPEVPSGPASEI